MAKIAAVRYFTRTGNTRKLAEQIASASGVKAEEIPAPVEQKVDILFLGASVYAYGVDESVKEYIAKLDRTKIDRVVIFSTSALVERAYPALKDLLAHAGLAVDERNFYCRGSFLILHRGRPNAKDLEDARKFALQNLERDAS